jgi:hypothetical protein
VDKAPASSAHLPDRREWQPVSAQHLQNFGREPGELIQDPARLVLIETEMPDKLFDQFEFDAFT